MKAVASILAIILFSTICDAAREATVLFSDTYDRPDNIDIDASTQGIGGVLAPLMIPLVYNESFEGSGLTTSIQIRNNQLNMAFGPAMSTLFLEHNFIDAAILTADGFSVSLDVISINTSNDIPNRFGGFGVGNSRAEALAAGDSQTSAAPLRPITGRANQGIGVSDFYVDVALDNNLRLWSNGDLLETIPVGVNHGTILADFYVSDFNAGSTVTVAVYFDGVYLSTQTFTWDYTDTNYLAFSARTPAEGVFMDDLHIATFYEDRAGRPEPANGAKDVDPATVVLQWNKGKDAAGNPNADIVQHYLYVAESEPNFIDVSPIVVIDTADPVLYDPPFIGDGDLDKIYFWRVDESVQSNGTPSGPNDPNTIVGFVWSFETIKSVPIIVTQPVDVLVDPGQTAVFTLEIQSLSPATFKWYKAADPAIIPGISDELVGTTQTLTLENVQLADEGYYYCIVSNDSGVDVPSNAVFLGVKRLIAWYALEENLVDSAGGNNGISIKTEPNLTYVDGVIGKAVVFNGTDEAVEIPRSIQDSFTIAFWVKTTDIGATGLWYNGWGLIDGEMGGVTNDFGTALLGSKFGFGVGNPDTTISSQTDINDDQWHYCVATRDRYTGQMQLYVDGKLEAAATGGTGVRDAAAVLNIGRIQTGINYFEGQIDEVQLFNYAMDRFGVADRYYAVTEKPVCNNPDNINMSYDVAGGGPNGDQPNCQVDLADLVVLVSEWLNCGLYPAIWCP